MNSTSYSEYLAPCCNIAQQAGELIMTYFQTGHETRKKEDNSPVTDADVKANQLITKSLFDLFPNILIIAEEDELPPTHGHGLFWLVDPLDGTRAFVRGEPEFTVNIGLICHGTPVMGVIYAPPQDLLYYGAQGVGAFRQHGKQPAQPINVRTPPAQGLTVVKSKSHPSPATTAYLETLKVHELIAGSSSFKFCMVADGSADIYPRFGRTMEWDTAAGHAILSAAGGRVETTDGTVLTYGKAGYENPFFIGFGG